MHVRCIQGAFAFVKVAEQQVSTVCDRFDGVKYLERFVHVSKVRPQMKGCKRCLQLGHGQETCIVEPVCTQDVPQSLTIQEKVTAEPTKVEESMQVTEEVVLPPPEEPSQTVKEDIEPSSPEVTCQLVEEVKPPTPEATNHTGKEADPSTPEQASPDVAPNPPAPTEPTQVIPVEGISSILFAKQWVGEEHSDEWPSDKEPVKAEPFNGPLPTPPCKRKRSEDEKPPEKPSQTPAKFLSGVKLSKAEQDKEMLRTLRKTGSTSCGDAKFVLVKKQPGAVNLSSKVTCSKCKGTIMVKSVSAHVLSKTHKSGTKHF